MRERILAKSTSELRGLRDVRTMSGSRKRSIPNTRESTYLRLYMLRMENDRLSQEYASVEKRRLGLKRRLDDIRREIDLLAESETRVEQSPGGDSSVTAATHCAGRTSRSSMPIRY
jgi:chromosome segregation ATPase